MLRLHSLDREYGNHENTARTRSGQRLICGPAGGDGCVDMSIEIEQKVGQLYDDACRRNPTYETVVHREFCSSMDEVFGGDVEGSQSAFEYAREAYGYQTADEIKAVERADWKQGVCKHGLDHMTCPCGCFEF